MGIQKLGRVQGEGGGSRPPHPPQLAFCFDICAPHPHQCPSNKSVLIEDSSVLEVTRKCLVECDLASPLFQPPLLCVRVSPPAVGFVLRAKELDMDFVCSWGFLFPFLAVAKAFGYF